MHWMIVKSIKYESCVLFINKNSNFSQKYCETKKKKKICVVSDYFYFTPKKLLGILCRANKISLQKHEHWTSVHEVGNLEKIRLTLWYVWIITFVFFRNLQKKTFGCLAIHNLQFLLQINAHAKKMNYSFLTVLLNTNK